jgi:cobalt-zinc-cadmium efflux system outer membrane protein
VTRRLWGSTLGVSQCGGILPAACQWVRARWPVEVALVLVGAARPPSACAQQPTAWTLGDVVAIALRQNPDVIAARLAVDSARAEQGIARALPSATFAIIPGTPFQRAVGATLDFGPQRLFRTQAAGRGTTAARLAWADVARQVTFRVRQAFYDILLADSLRAIARERRDIFRALVTADSIRWRAGDLPERNVTKSELALASAEADLARADAQAHTARLVLQTLLGSAAPDTSVAIRGSLAWRPVELPPEGLLDSLARYRRPDVAAAAARVRQARSLHALATAELVPTPTVDLVYQATAPFPNGSHYAVGVSFALPLFSWNAGERARAATGVAAAEAAARSINTQVTTELIAAVDAFRTARDLAARYEAGLVAKAADALEISRFAYQAGAISQLDLLDAVRAYGEIRANYYAALHDYWVSLYALDRAVGEDVLP